MSMRSTTLALTTTLALAAGAHAGATFVDAKSNIFGYGISTPELSGGGGGLNAVIVALPAGIGRVLTISASGTAWWNGPNGANGPDGGLFAASTNISGLGPISGYASPLTGMLVGLFLESGDISALAAPANASYPDAASLTATDYSPLNRQVFFIGDGLTGTGSGVTQSFHIPDSAVSLILGIADSANFNGTPGWYGDNVGGYEVNYDVAVPAPASLALLGLGGLLAARCRR